MSTKLKQRVFLSVFFFVTGFSFSSWTSRIPTIKEQFDFDDATLSNILMILPVSSFLGLPLSAWLVAKFDSRSPLLVSSFFFTGALVLIGFSNSLFVLVPAVFLFSFTMRIINIAMNTQAIAVQKAYNRKINGSFHGLWSTGGIAGLLLSTFMVAHKVSLANHMLVAALVALVLALVSYPFLLKNDKASAGNKLILGKPDKFILFLGLLVLLAAICEGGMFDWSGVFFREVVGEELFTLGYLTFMIFMASSRFVSDRLVERLGMPITYKISAISIAAGMLLAVLLPTFWWSLAGFCLVGFGTASVIPMSFSLAGTSRKYSPGMAISIITTYAIAGMFLGPPLIGYLSAAFGLRSAFITFIIAGISIIPVSQWYFKLKTEE